jgi:hypothetical protein
MLRGSVNVQVPKAFVPCAARARSAARLQRLTVRAEDAKGSLTKEESEKKSGKVAKVDRSRTPCSLPATNRYLTSTVLSQETMPSTLWACQTPKAPAVS